MAREPVGTLFVTAAVGRALLRGEASVRACDVLEVAGGFVAGDTVHLVGRGIDGGQGVLGIGPVRVAAVELHGLAAESIVLATTDWGPRS